MEAVARISVSGRLLRYSVVEVPRSSVRRGPCSQGILSLIADRRRFLCMSSLSAMDGKCSASPAMKIAEPFFRSVISSMEKEYLNKNPTASAILNLVRSSDGDNIIYDHFAFRTFGVDGHGIDSMAKFFVEFGYTPQDELRFPAKKLRALWFSPPATEVPTTGAGIQGPLPRIFISELRVEEMSSESQETIRKYTNTSGCGSSYSTLASALGSLTWDRPLYSDYQLLLRESEYAAWTLINGYGLNHVTISTHRLKSRLRDINALNEYIQRNGYKVNSEGGTLKVSPDGLLRQSSTVADSITFTFAEGVSEKVSCAYIEFAERLVLPQFKDLPAHEVKERHRRDGFEVGNADKIFESTSNDLLKRIAT